MPYIYGLQWIGLGSADHVYKLAVITFVR